MPTYSLTLREPLNRKLTIQEVDNNWLYLEDLSLMHYIPNADPDLYGGTEIWLFKNNNGYIQSTGFGKFYTPKYDQNVDGFGIWSNIMKGSITNVVGGFIVGEKVVSNNGGSGYYVSLDTIINKEGNWTNSTSMIGDDSGSTADISGFVSYTIGDKVIWGGMTWTSLNGDTQLPNDIYNLNSAFWELIPYNDTDYNVVYAPITYDIKNDFISGRKEVESNIEVSCSYEISRQLQDNWGFPALNSIKAIQWGNPYSFSTSKGHGSIIVENSYVENVNLMANYFINISAKNSAYISNLTANNAYIYNLTANNGSITELTSNNGSIYNLTSNNGSIGSLNVNNGSSISSLNVNNGSISSLSVNNGSNITELNANNGSATYNLTATNNGSISNLTAANNGSNIYNLTADNGSISKLTAANNSNISNLSVENGKQLLNINVTGITYDFLGQTESNFNLEELVGTPNSIEFRFTLYFDGSDGKGALLPFRSNGPITMPCWTVPEGFICTQTFVRTINSLVSSDPSHITLGYESDSVNAFIDEDSSWFDGVVSVSNEPFIPATATQRLVGQVTGSDITSGTVKFLVKLSKI